MKKILFIFLVLVLCCVFLAYLNNDPRIIISNLVKKNGNIKKGELRYRVYLLGVLPVGEAVLGIERVEEYKGQKVYHLSANAQSFKVFSRLFSGYALLDSYIDIKQSYPIAFRQRLQISGKDDIDREITYDQENGVMSIGGVKRQILVNTQDPLSAIFNLKRMDLGKVKEFKMNINTNQKNYILKSSAIQQVISVDKITYKITLAKAEIYRNDKNLYHKSSITMTLLQGKENIPILIKIFAGGVLMNARLIDIK